MVNFYTLQILYSNKSILFVFFTLYFSSEVHYLLKISLHLCHKAKH
jgi:hypothetical protein